MSITIESVRLPERGQLKLELSVVTTINTTAEEARRKVSVFAGDVIADLLSGETPGLVWQKERAYWRVPVALHSRSLGRIGQVGVVDVDVETGELQINDQIIQDIGDNAQRFAAGAAL